MRLPKSRILRSQLRTCAGALVLLALLPGESSAMRLLVRPQSLASLGWVELVPTLRGQGFVGFRSVNVPAATNVEFKAIAESPEVGSSYEWTLTAPEGGIRESFTAESRISWQVPDSKNLDYHLLITGRNGGVTETAEIRGRIVKTKVETGYKITPLGRILPTEIAKSLERDLAVAAILLEIDSLGRGIAAIPGAARTVWSSASELATLVSLTQALPVLRTIQDPLEKANLPLYKEVAKVLGEESLGQVSRGAVVKVTGAGIAGAETLVTHADPLLLAVKAGDAIVEIVTRLVESQIDQGYRFAEYPVPSLSSLSVIQVRVHGQEGGSFRSGDQFWFLDSATGKWKLYRSGLVTLEMVEREKSPQLTPQEALREALIAFCTNRNSLSEYVIDEDRRTVVRIAAAGGFGPDGSSCSEGYDSSTNVVSVTFHSKVIAEVGIQSGRGPKSPYLLVHRRGLWLLDLGWHSREAKEALSQSLGDLHQAILEVSEAMTNVDVDSIAIRIVEEDRRAFRECAVSHPPESRAAFVGVGRIELQGSSIAQVTIATFYDSGKSSSQDRFTFVRRGGRWFFDWK